MPELREIKPEYPDTNLKEPLHGSEINGAPYKALTAADGTLANAVIRIAELEAALKALRLLK